MMLALALLCPLQGALAFEPEEWVALRKDDQAGQAFRLEARAELRAWSALSPGSLSAVSAWLTDADLSLSFSGEGWQAELRRAGGVLLSAAEGRQGDRRVLALPEGNVAFETSGEGDPLWLLTGREAPALGWLEGLPPQETLRDLPEDVKALIAPYGKAVKRRTSLKNVGTSTQRTEHQLDAESFAAVWPALREWLEDRLSGLPIDASGLLSGLSFEKKVTLSLLRDRADEPLGWLMSATVRLPSGSVRKLSLLCASAPGKGLFLSLKAPAARGTDDLSLSVSAAFDRETLNADLAWLSRLNGEKHSLKGSVSLSLSGEGEAGRMKGRLRLEEKRGSQPAETLTLSPDLIRQGQSVSGSVQVQRERAGKPALDLTLRGELGPGEAPELPAAARIYDADAAPEAARAALEEALLPRVRALLMSFPEETRRLLLHDMGRTARTQGDTLPPAAQAPAPVYIVTEDADKGGTP